MAAPAGSRRGYLNEDFRLFHIRDRRELEFEYHYHEFNKIVVFISGRVNYIMEGKSYFLQPWDILLVSQNQIHRPVIDVSEPYERIVLWINTNYIQGVNRPDCDLFRCFQLARQRAFSLIRPAAQERVELMRLLSDTEKALSCEEFAHDIMARTYFLQFLVALNRIALNDDTPALTDTYRSDPRLNAVLNYINENLDAELSLDALSAKFYISKSHLMRRFKEMTGCTTHGYILQKRLMSAAELIKAGSPVIEASAQCGFNDYSAFLRAFKHMFGVNPSDLI